MNARQSNTQSNNTPNQMFERMTSSSRRRVIGICFVLASVCCCACTSAEAQLSCKDENGEPVDWYIGYKFPEFKKADNNFATGYAYAYLTSKDISRQQQANVDGNIIPTDDSESHIFLYRFKELLYKYIGQPFKINGVAQARVVYSKTRRSGRRLSKDITNWTVSQKILSEPGSIIMKTLEDAYDSSKKNINSILYNDDPPTHPDDEKEMRNQRRAHAKGVLLMDEKTGDGIWLTHSVPQFPPTRDQKLRFLENSVRFGQTFMCVSFDLHKSGKQIVDHLINMRPLIYEHTVSETMYSLIPDLDDLAHEGSVKYKKVPVVPKLSQLITTKEGQVLHLYSKSRSFDADIYASWIDQDIGSALFVETWRRGSGEPLNSSCPLHNYHVNNVQDLKYDDKISWTYKHDHSKWAISDEKDKGIVCIGDSNRMASQFKRGGGAVCIKCPICWTVFSNTILDLEPCPRPAAIKKNKDIGLLKRFRQMFGL